MSDEQIREAERRLSVDPHDREAFAQVVRAYALAGQRLPYDVLARTPRWEPLRELVERWFAEPLTEAGGASWEEIEAAEARVGVRFPDTLREWFRLVGKRLEDVQDSPVRLEGESFPVVEHEDGRISVWYENQGVWMASVPAGDDGDPVVEVTGYSGAPDRDDPPVRLSAFLRGQILNDCLVGAWSGRGRGPLGELAAEVVGGRFDDPPSDAELKRLFDSYPVRSEPNPTPFYGVEPYRGDEETVICFDSWMTATPEACERLLRVLDWAESGWRELHIVVRDPSAEEDSGVLSGELEPLPEMIRERLGDLGHLGMYGASPGRWLHMRISTHDPDAAFERVRDLLPAECEWTAAERPQNVARFRVLHPPGKTEFRPPR